MAKLRVVQGLGVLVLAVLACGGDPEDAGPGAAPAGEASNDRGSGDGTGAPSGGGDGSGSPGSGSGNPGTGTASEGAPGSVPLQPGEGGGAAGSGEPGSSGGSSMEGGGATAEPPALENVLVFSRTTGYRHEAIPASIEAIRQLGMENGFAVTATEDPAMFTDATLAGFDVVVFSSTTGDVLDGEQQAALERFVQAGHGWVGIHSASDTEYDWAWYGQLVGAYFLSHPPGMPVAQLDVEATDHAATAHLPARLEMTDEWYNFRTNPRAEVNVLLRIDESTYAPGEGAMGTDHPMAWYHEFDGGRAFYTALGHAIAQYSDPRFTQHILGGIRWAAGVAP